MRFTKRVSRQDYIMRLPLVALIDVVFFLLLYFVMAGTLAASEAELPTTLSPSLRGSGKGSDFASQVLYVEMNGKTVQYRMAGNVMGSKADVVKLLEQLPKDPGVVIRVADEAPVAAAAAALQAATDAGFRKVTYVAGK